MVFPTPALRPLPSPFWSPVVHRLRPYVAGEQPGLPDVVKLNTNESPYGPAPQVLEALRLAVNDDLRRYPDPSSEQLRVAIAAHHGVDPAQVFVGNGSDEILAFAFCALLSHDGPVLFPDVSYSFYPAYCHLFGLAFRAVPVTADLEIRIDDYSGPCAGVVLANPNAPTGIGLDSSAIRRLVRMHPDRAVVVDEAYVDFGGETSLPLVREHDNVLVVRTLSKSRGLAGLRVGYSIGHRDLIEALERARDSFNSYPLDSLAQAGARAAMDADDHFEETRRKIIATRARLVEGLGALGFHVLPSQANFVFAAHPRVAAACLSAALRDARIFVRHFDAPRIENYLRISVGTPADIDRLLATLRTLVPAA